VTRRSATLFLILAGFLLLIAGGLLACSTPPQPEDAGATSEIARPSPMPPPTETPPPVSFDGERAYQDVKIQVDFGPRVPGMEGHNRIQAWIREELANVGWQVEIQESQVLGQTIENIVAKRSEDPPQIILGAHYDTRIFADNDPDPAQRTNFVPGANDGASGVAVLLELARTLPTDTVPVWLVFFDAEDNGGIEGWEWILALSSSWIWSAMRI
jgi:acetylornithine deacetylase/succinyl-diaminopimelate desuccinylase-like protein